MVVQTAVEELKSLSSGTAQTASRIEQAVGTLHESMTILGHTVSEARTAIETIHSATSALMTSTGKPSRVTSNTPTLLTDGRADVRKRTEQIASTTRFIQDKVFQREPILPETLGHDMKRIISGTLRRNLKEIEDSQVPANNPRSGPHSSWRLESSTSSQRVLTKSTIFGTLSIHSWTSSRVNNRTCGEADEQRKETTVTTVRFFLAPWLSSKAFPFTYNALKLHGANWQPPSPTWGLRTVNVIPYDSAIFTAVESLDIDAVRTLFDEGRASPFDIDSTGRTMLGFLGLGARVGH